MSNFGAFGGIRVIESPYVGKLTTPEVPCGLIAYRGPYKQRRIKRWRKRHPPYYAPTGKYFTMGGDTVVCHPIDAIKLREALRHA